MGNNPSDPLSAEPLSEERLRQLEAAHKAATPGPWTADCHGGMFYVWGPDKTMVADGDNEGGWVDPEVVARIRGVGRGATEAEQEANATLIALARTALPALLAEVHRLREAVEQKEMQIVGCMVAASGVRPGHALSVGRDNPYWTVAYGDVERLYARMDWMRRMLHNSGMHYPDSTMERCWICSDAWPCAHARHMEAAVGLVPPAPAPEGR